jgi:hypothetical protein
LKHLIATWQHQLRELEKMEYQKLEWIQTHYLVISTPFSYPHFIRVLLPMSDVWQLNFLRDKIKNTHFMKAQRNTNNPYYFSVFFAAPSSCSRHDHPYSISAQNNLSPSILFCRRQSHQLIHPPYLLLKFLPLYTF